MTFTERRSQVIEEAKTWLGTKFMHQAALKGVGVDCAHLVDEVYTACGLVKRTVYPVYGQDWFRHAEREDKYIVEGFLAAGCREIPESEVGPGDTAIVKFGRAYSHCAIIIEWPKLVVCAWPTMERVCLVNATEDRIYRNRQTRFFTPFK